MTTTPAGKNILERMVLAVERVRERLLRATAALEEAGIPYAVAGDNAVAAWVASVDPAAVRNSQGVDIRLRRNDLDAAEKALAGSGFVRRHVAGIDVFSTARTPRPATPCTLSRRAKRSGRSMSRPRRTSMTSHDRTRASACSRWSRWSE